MNDNIPIVRKTSLLSLIPQLLILFALMILSWQVVSPDNLGGSFWGAAAYLVYSFGSKTILLKHHRTGMHFARLGSHQEAIREFQLSYEFLSRHEWLDRFRFITMLDSSAIPYREMALCNIAYSHVQLGEDLSALQYYQRALKEFPESELAKEGVRHFESQGMIRSSVQ